MADSSYYVAFLITQNSDLLMRVAASAQQESGDTLADPEQWARDHKWEYSTQADWVSAVMAAMDTGITAWGSNPGVVTDQHILSYVQGALAP
jgi:hypothetical protein